MAASTTTWAPGFSEHPQAEPVAARTIVEMLDRIGDELVRYPPGAADARPMTRRELLARVLWTRALLDADGTATKLIIEYLDGKPGDSPESLAEAALIHADDMAAAEALLKEVMRGE